MTPGRAGVCVLALAWLTLSAALPVAARGEPAPDAADPDFAVAPSGRRFRVRFDPASRVWLGMSEAVRRDAAGGAAGVPEIALGVSYRARYASGEGLGRVAWQVDHRAVSGWVAPSIRPAEGAPALDVVAYEASLLRHDERPSVVLPMSPPVSIPFPFDIGLEAEVGRVFIPPYGTTSLEGAGAQETAAPMVHVGVVRAALLLDPWRSGAPGQSFAIGVGVRYDVDAYAGRPPADGALERPPRLSLGAPRVIHRVAPMTAGSLRLRLQGDDGLTVVDCRGDVVPHWTSEETWRLMVLSFARVERTIAAVNDQPIAAALEGGYRLLPGTPAYATVHDVRVSLGLSFALQLR